MPIRLGMLGMWHTHADGIVRQVVAHPDEFRLVGFHDADSEVVAARRGSWGASVPDFRVFDRPEDLLREPLDGVVVEGRVFENLHLAKMALESGRSVMLEKPAGENLDEFRRLVDLAQRKHLHVQMIYLFRYMSAVVELLRRVRQGELGRVYEFRARLPKDLPSYGRYERELGRYQGGIFFEMAGHVIDLMVALLGRPSLVAPFLAHHHTQPGTFIDNGLAVYRFATAWGIVEVPALEVAPHSRRVEVYGTRGACVIPHLGSGHLANRDIQPIEVYREGAPDWQRIDLPAQTLQISDLREFAACIAGKKAPDYSIEHDLDVQEALLRSCAVSQVQH
jgi:predicted dehydrogenase